jgi:hypothetical protein
MCSKQLLYQFILRLFFAAKNVNYIIYVELQN